MRFRLSFQFASFGARGVSTAAISPGIVWTEEFSFTPSDIFVDDETPLSMDSYILQKVTKNLDWYGIEMSSGRSKIISHSDRAWTVALLVKELKIVKVVRELWVIVQKGCFGLVY